MFLEKRFKNPFKIKIWDIFKNIFSGIPIDVKNAKNWYLC